MSRLFVAGVGAGICHLTREQCDLLESGIKIVLSTNRCELSDWLDSKKISHISFDEIYDEAEDFDELNKKIAAKLMAMAKTSDTVFAMPGSAIGTPLISAIYDAASDDVNVTVLPGISIAQAAIAAMQADISYRAQSNECYAYDLSSKEIDTRFPLCIMEIDNKLLAGDVKLFLMEYYPQDLEIVVTKWVDGAFAHEKMPLHELDRLSEYSHMTCALLPSVEFRQLERYGLRELEQVISTLRAPGGCPWDREQTHSSIRKDLIEETYELVEAIDELDDAMMCEELGDMLMQVAFHAELAKERSAFSLRDVTTDICKKLIYRHPHVFSNVIAETTDAVLNNWEDLKRTEKGMETHTDAMKAVCKALPALMRAQKLQKKASKVGFDWSNPLLALEKVTEEEGEVREELEKLMAGEPNDAFEELGDLLFSVANVARLARVESEMALKSANEKFVRRFSQMESVAIRDHNKLEDLSLEEKEIIWQQIKIK